jgi:2-methylaconitate cis-trans-isomerase PrpF
MKNWFRSAISAASLIILLCLAAAAQNAAGNSAQKESAMTAHATGTFEVKMEPQSEEKTEGATLVRTLLSKQFHGALEGTSKVEMLSAMSSVKGSAGYVAIEHFTGTLGGRSGTFVLQHSGTMTRGTPQLSITVVPDSGTGQLTGLSGKMTVDVSGGKHSYVFDYAIEGAH